MRQKTTGCMHSLNKFWTKDAKRQKHPTVIFGEPGTKSGCREKKQSTAHAPCTQHHLRGGVADHLSHHSRLTTGHTPVLVAQSCPTFVTPVDHTLPGSSVHGILQGRIMELVAILFSRGSSWPRGRTQGSCIAGRFFTLWATREALNPHLM